MVFRGEPNSATASARPAARASRRAAGRLGKRGRGRGQGLVEFAISLPVVLLMILFGVDFGRVFLGWVTLTNAAREAANFAALNPSAWQSPVNATVQTEYFRLINAEAARINCALPGTLPVPTFPNGDQIGSPATVSITCRFSLITPLIGLILGNPIDVSASASFPIRTGTIEGIPVASTIPSGSLGAGATATVAPTDTDAPTATPIPTPSQAPTPVPMCTVPTLENVNTAQAVGRWTTNGFTANNLIFSPAVPPNYKIKTQSLPATTSVACGSVMTVTQN